MDHFQYHVILEVICTKIGLDLRPRQDAGGLRFSHSCVYILLSLLPWQPHNCCPHPQASEGLAWKQHTYADWLAMSRVMWRHALHSLCATIRSSERSTLCESSPVAFTLHPTCHSLCPTLQVYTVPEAATILQGYVNTVEKGRRTVWQCLMNYWPSAAG